MSQSESHADLRRALEAAKEDEGEYLESEAWRRTFEEDRPAASWPAVEDGVKRVLGIETEEPRSV